MRDPYRDFNRWNDEQEERLAELPECEECGEHIQDEYLWDIDGQILCEDCARKLYRRFTC